MTSTMLMQEATTDERCPVCDCEVILVTYEDGRRFDAECACCSTAVLA